MRFLIKASLLVTILTIVAVSLCASPARGASLSSADAPLFSWSLPPPLQRIALFFRSFTDAFNDGLASIATALIPDSIYTTQQNKQPVKQAANQHIKSTADSLNPTTSNTTSAAKPTASSAVDSLTPTASPTPEEDPLDTPTSGERSKEIDFPSLASSPSSPLRVREIVREVPDPALLASLTVTREELQATQRNFTLVNSSLGTITSDIEALADELTALKAQLLSPAIQTVIRETVVQTATPPGASLGNKEITASLESGAIAPTVMTIGSVTFGGSTLASLQTIDSSPTVTGTLTISGTGTSTIASSLQVARFLTAGDLLTVPYFTATSTTATSTLATGGFTVGTNKFVVQQSSGNVGIGTTSPGARFTLTGSDTAATKSFILTDSANTQLLSVSNNGHIVIGTTTLVNHRLEVSGSVSLERASFISVNDSGRFIMRVANQSSGEINLRAHGPSYNETLFNNSMASASGLFGQMPAGKPMIVGNVNAGPLVLGANNAERMRIDTGGNIGIGTTSPGALLDVSASNSNTTLTTAGSPRIVITNTNTSASNFADLSLTTMDANGAQSEGVKIAGVFTSHSAGAVSGELAILTRNAGTLAEVMRVTSAGNVGIGKTNPGRALSVVGAGEFTTDLFAYGADINLGTGSATTTLTTSATAFAITANATTTLGTTGLNIGSGQLVVQQTSGNVGIGTTNPTAPFHFSSAMVNSFDFLVENTYAANSATGVIVKTTNGQVVLGKTASANGCITGGIANAGCLSISGNNAFILGTNDAVRMTIDGIGNVGIGETAPGSKLSVSGGATIGASYDTTAAPSNGLIIEGSLGIGTTTPGSLLAVQGVANFAPSNSFLYSQLTLPSFTATSTTATSTIGGGLTTAGLASSNGLTITGGSLLQTNTATSSFAGGISAAGLNSSAGLTLTGGNIAHTGASFVVQSGGNVGIGTTGPGANLHVFKSGGVVADFEREDVTAASLLSQKQVNIVERVTAGGTANLFGLGRDEAGTAEGWHAFNILNGGVLEIVSGTSGASQVSSMAIITSGNVGIGETAPGSKLSVSGGATIGASYDTTAAPSNGLIIEGTVGIGTTGPGDHLHVVGITRMERAETGAQSFIRLFEGATERGRIGLDVSNQLALMAGVSDSPALSVKSDGNVGIGTTGPDFPLQVERNQNAITQLTVTNSTSGTAGGVNIAARTDGGAVFNMYALSTGFTTSGPLVANAGVLHADQNFSGGLSIAAIHTSGVIRFYTGGGSNAATTERMRITAAGNLGIGTTSPSAKFAFTGDGTGATRAFVIADSANTERVSVLNNGNVGVGNTVPTTRFHISDSLTSGYAFRITGTGSGDGSNAFSIGATAPSGREAGISMRGGSGQSLFINAGETSDGANDGDIVLAGDQTGNVGIGDSSPLAKFVVGSGDLFRVDSSGRVLLPAGASGAGNLALSTTGDTNTGLYFSAADEMTLQTGGSNRVTIDSSGNVGIGMTNPQTKLDVGVVNTTFFGYVAHFGQDGSPTGFVFSTANNSAGDGFGNNFVIERYRGTHASRTAISAGDEIAAFRFTGYTDSRQIAAQIMASADTGWGATGTDSPGRLTFWTTPDGSGTLAERMRIDNNGNVGIGDTSPAAMFVVGSGDLFRVDSSGRILLPAGASGAGNLALSTTGDTNTGLYFSAADEIRVQTGGSDRVTINSTGNVGIGTTSPASLFSVAGAGYFTGNVGIGVANPTAALHVSGNEIRQTGTDPFYSFYNGTTRQGYVQYETTANDLLVFAERAGGYVRVGPTLSVNSTDNFATLDVNGVGAHGLGAVGAPSFAFRTDLDTGMWSSGANTINFSTGGSERVRIQSDGNVGIGTAAPGAKLEIVGAQVEDSKMLRLSNAAQLSIYWELWRDNLVTGHLFFGEAVGGAKSTRVTFATGGNVGIGTTSPVQLLSVSGTSALAGAVSVGAGYGGTAPPSNGMIIQGNVGIGTTSPMAVLSVNSGQIVGAAGSASAPTYGFTTDAGTGIFSGGASSDVLAFSTGASERVRIDSSGNVGIGTATPAKRLDVITTGTGTDGLRVRQSSSGNDPILELYHVNNHGFRWRIDNNAADLHLDKNTAGTYTNDVMTVVNDSSKVGIGQTAPGSALSVNGGISAGTYSATAAPSGGMIISGNVGIGTTTPGSILSIQGVANFAPTNSFLYSQLTLPSFTATSTTATSTIAGGLSTAGLASSNGLTLSGGIFNSGVTATSSMAGGLSLTSLAASNGITLTGGILRSAVTATSTLDGGLAITAGGLRLSTLTAGSVLFAGASGALQENNANLFWDNTNGRLGIGTTGPGNKLSVNATGSLTTPTAYFGNGNSGYIGIGELEMGEDDGTYFRVVPQHNYSIRIASSGFCPSGACIFEVTNTSDTPLLTVGLTGNVGIGTTSPGSLLALQSVANFAPTNSFLYSQLTLPSFTATSTTATSTISGGLTTAGLASSNGLTLTGGIFNSSVTATSSMAGGLSLTSLSASNGITLTGGILRSTATATSTFDAGIATAGLSSSNGLTVTGGNLLLTVPETNTAAATSTWSGGVSTAGLASSNGLTLTGGILRSTVTATSTLDGGLAITAGGLRLSTLTAGSVLFAGASGALQENNANLFWDNTNGRLGIGTTSPSARLSVTSAGTGTGRAFAVADSSNVERLTVLDNGNVGIGSTTPGSLLALAGRINWNNGLGAITHLLGPTDQTFAIAAGAGASGAGNSITITASNSVSESNAGGNITLQSGNGFGSSSGGSAGSINILGGSTSVNNAGVINITGGAGTGGANGGIVTITGGIGGGAGGHVALVSGTAPSGNATGNITLTTTNSAGGGPQAGTGSGNILLTTGNNLNGGGSVGYINLTAGSVATDSSIATGYIAMTTGGYSVPTSGSVTTGAFTLTIPAGPNAPGNSGHAGNGGAITLTGGAGGSTSFASSNAGNGSSVSIIAGAGGAATGSGAGGSGGSLTLRAGAGGSGVSSNGTAGQLLFQTSGASTRMVVDGSGNVGIASTSPYATLSVAGAAIGRTLLALDALSGQTAPIFDVKIASTTQFLISSSGNLGLATTSPGSLLAIQGVANFAPSNSFLYSQLTLPSFTATSTTATSTVAGGLSTAGLASSNGLTLSGGILNSSVTATSSMAGGLSLTTLAASNGLTVTGGNLLLTVPETNTSVATSTWSGGIATAGLSSSNGITLTGGILNSSVTATSSMAGGLSLTTLAASNGLTVTGGTLLSSVPLTFTGTGTSTMAGGISTAGLASSNGLTLTGGNIVHTGASFVVQSSGNVGIGTTGPGYLTHIRKSSDSDYTANNIATYNRFRFPRQLAARFLAAIG